MPLPPFNMHGLLPPFLGTDGTATERSPYMVTMSELAASLGTTPHRRQLLRNLITYRSLITGDGYQRGLQFIDGSFVEDVEKNRQREPSDIDVYTLLHVQSQYAGNPPHWNASKFKFWSEEIVDRAKNKERYSLDTYAQLLDSLDTGRLIREVIYWYSLFSHQKLTYAWKGFAVLMLDPAGDQAALAVLGSE